MAMNLLRVPSSARARLSSVSPDSTAGFSSNANFEAGRARRLSSLLSSNPIQKSTPWFSMLTKNTKKPRLRKRRKDDGGEVKNGGKPTVCHFEIGECNNQDEQDIIVAVDDGSENRCSKCKKGGSLSNPSPELRVFHEPSPAFLERPSRRTLSTGSHLQGSIPTSLGLDCNTLQVPLSRRRSSTRSSKRMQLRETSFCTVPEDETAANGSTLRTFASTTSTTRILTAPDTRCDEEVTDGITGDAVGDMTFNEPSMSDYRKKLKKRRRRKNIISAKLGFAFLLVSIAFFVTVYFVYSHVPEKWQKQINVRTFVNMLVLDSFICIVSPLALLYGSKELRKSVRTILFKR